MSGPLFLPERLRRALAACGTALALAATLAVQVPAAQAQAPELAIAVKDGSTSFVEGSATGITYVVSITNSVQFSSDAFIDVNFSEEGGPWNTASGPGIKTNRFRAGVNSTEIDYTINDNMDMGGGSVTATVVTVAGENYTVNAAQASVTVTIVDDDLPAVSITADDADSSVAEGSDVVFTISSTDMPAGGLAVPVTVSQMGNYAVSGGTGSSTVRIPGGQTSVKFTVRTDNDNTDENDGSITASIGTLPASHQPGSMTSATVTVTDDEAQPSIDLPETINTADTADNVVVTLTLVPASGPTRGLVTEKEVSTVYETIDGSAIAGTDYTAIPTSTLIFEAGSNTARITIDIIAPDADEDADNFSLAFLSASNATIRGLASGGANIIIQEKPSLSITRDGPATISEAGSATFTVAITLPQSEAVVVPVTAVETGNMLGAVPPLVTIAAGQSSAVLNLPLDNDGRDEEDSTVTLSIALPSGSGDTYSLGTSEATLDITDDDAPVISFAPAEAVEGMPLQFRVSLSGASERTVRVNYETESAASDGSGGMPGGGDGSASGTATAGDDYMARMLTTLAFLPGEVEKIIEVQTMRDQVEDPDETVILLLSLPADANATLPGFTPGMEGQPGMPVRVVGTISEGLNDDEIQALNEAILPHVAATVADETSLAISDRINAAFDGGGAAGPSAFQPYVDLLSGDGQAWINTASSLADGGIQSPAFMPQDFNFTYYPGRRNHSGGPNHSPLEGLFVDGSGLPASVASRWGARLCPPHRSGLSSTATPPQGGSDSLRHRGTRPQLFYTAEAKYGIPVLQQQELLVLFARTDFSGDTRNHALGADLNIGKYFSTGIEVNAGAYVNSDVGTSGYLAPSPQPAMQWNLQEADRPGVPPQPNREMMHRAYLRYERQF